MFGWCVNPWITFFFPERDDKALLWHINLLITRGYKLVATSTSYSSKERANNKIKLGYTDIWLPLLHSISRQMRCSWWWQRSLAWLKETYICFIGWVVFGNTLWHPRDHLYACKCSLHTSFPCLYQVFNSRALSPLFLQISQFGGKEPLPFVGAWIPWPTSPW